ncbi:twin transmembrane helix small protein [Curvivirga aplysinae]|uniref:twin transmembrane helix small protein n=1 Tax=Curvivirga aplysinae TaxID=2529852 RepID=UPI0012BCEDFC|nr:twin transmembrane helix small protein [Curvivirga aplysinae]MTI11300.1 twin transmembrane helix small protein [Curvivirga aplysinae]
MNIFATILMAIGLIATLAILAIGIISMARGGDFNDRWSNRLMRYRIIAQAFAIAMFMLGLYLMKNGGN